MDIDTISLVLGAAAGFILGAAILGTLLLRAERDKASLQKDLDHEREGRDAMAGLFALSAQEALDKNSERFLQLAQEKLKAAQADGAHDLEKKNKAIADLVDPIGKSLKEMEGKIENLGKAGAGLESQLKNFAEDQRMLRQETQNLVRTLRSTKDRGNWGELQLQKALEMIGMVEGTHFLQQQTVSNTDGKRSRPDFIIRMPGDMQIIIDVKTPVEPYWDALESAESEAAQAAAFGTFKKNVREHLKQLSAKEYWRSFDTPEFVVMFLPTEGLYSMAVSNDPQLIEDAAKNNVILASPTTLMGLLRVVMHGWQQQKMAEEAKTVSALASDLYSRVVTFGEHMDKLGRNLSTAVGAYDSAVGSLERSVLPGARKFKELHVQTGGKDVPELKELGKTTRAITATELLSGPDEAGEAESKKRA
ncbi:MAG: DNA recombination protein RmuC [Rhodospirillales bacterium]|nr:DNA recombination protein RmuC [Rhodospirillales bacterium]MCB9997272.1 DNA recombination protein RmuC [Rhodospirillales bacterium]